MNVIFSLFILYQIYETEIDDGFEQELRDRIKARQSELEQIEAEKAAKLAETEKESARLREISTQAAERQKEFLETSQLMEEQNKKIAEQNEKMAEAEKVFYFYFYDNIAYCVKI